MINGPGDLGLAAQPPHRSRLPILIMVIAVVVLAVAVGASVALVRHSNAHPQATESAPTYASTSCPATLTPGPDWRNLSDSRYAENLDLMVGNKLREEYVSVQRSMLAIFDNDYAEFVKDSETGWRKLAVRHTITVGHRSTVNGERVRRLTLTGEIDGDRYFYWVDLREGKQGYYQVAGWTSYDEHRQREREVTDVMRSFFEL
jgi:hypothetical protein